MRPEQTKVSADVLSFPRVSGDAPSLRTPTTPVMMFSPRERGCALQTPITTGPDCVFPA